MISHLLVCLGFMTALTGCRHKGFCLDHPHTNIYIEVEYDDDNDADDEVYLCEKVRATRLLAYHAATSDHVLASDMERRTNLLPLGEDTYHFIAYNAGTQSISFSERESFFTHGATTRECDILEPMYGSRGVNSDVDLDNGEQTMTACDPLWSTGAEALDCAPGDTIRLTAMPLHCRYTFEMRSTEPLSGISRVSSFITGMSRGATLGTTELHDTPVTVAVSAEVSSDRMSIVGSFMCFGHNPLIDTRHRMGLFVEMEDGKKYKLLEGDHFDVTEQVTGAANRRRVHIIIDGVKLPTSTIGAGFDVSVNPWGSGEDLDIRYDF